MEWVGGVLCLSSTDPRGQICPGNSPFPRVATKPRSWLGQISAGLDFEIELTSGLLLVIVSGAPQSKSSASRVLWLPYAGGKNGFS